jgi:hypothetical protein
VQDESNESKFVVIFGCYDGGTLSVKTRRKSYHVYETVFGPTGRRPLNHLIPFHVLFPEQEIFLLLPLVIGTLIVALESETNHST